MESRTSQSSAFAGGENLIAADADRPGRAWWPAAVVCLGAAALGTLAATDLGLPGSARVAAALGLTVLVIVGVLAAPRRARPQTTHASHPTSGPSPSSPAAEPDRTQERLAQTEELLRAAFESAPIGIAVESTEGKFLTVNPALCRMLGYEAHELRRMTFPEVTHPDDRGADFVLMSRLLRGEVSSGQVQKRYRRKDGRWIWVDVAVSLVRDARGEPYRFVIQARDITRPRKAEARLRLQRDRFKRIVALRKRMLERERALLAELNHRVRNNLASLLGLISIYERGGRDDASVASALRGKIGAMKGVHEAVTDGSHGAVDLTDLLGRLRPDTGNPTNAPRVRISGPPTFIQPSQAGAFAMIIQELFTNSLRHGALGSEDGFIAITWEHDNSSKADMLHLCWEEHTPRDLGPHKDPGIGLTLIRGLAASELRGHCEFDFRPCGLTCRLDALLSTHEPPGLHSVSTKESVS